ncbi:hypothetical protein TNCV_481831 [Trichonephila clavipes]|nr:hypothetical protein TNCV_481831 [Trichonephila clavipes]
MPIPLGYRGHIGRWEKDLWGKRERFYWPSQEFRKKEDKKVNNLNKVRIDHDVSWSTNEGIDSSMAGPLPSDLSPVEHVWDQIKRQKPSCHSVYDLEMVAQDL